MALAVAALPAVPAWADGELNVYNWGEYINPEVLKKFEAETGTKVKLDTYSSNEEMLAKVQAGDRLRHHFSVGPYARHHGEARPDREDRHQPV